MIQDLLDAKQQFDQIKQRQKSAPLKLIKINANTVIREKKQQFESFTKQFSNLNNVASLIGDSIKSISDTYKTLALIVIGAGAALTGVAAYIKNLNSDSLFGDEGGLFGGSGMSTGKLSEKGKQMIKNHEGGLQTHAYWDVDGYSIGYGHHGLFHGRRIQENDTITKEEADKLFEQDIAKYEAYVNKSVKVPVTQNMFDAMVDYAYNVGSLGPKFLQKINSGDYRGAMAELSLKQEMGKDGKMHEQNETRMKDIRALFGTDISANNTLSASAINEPTGQTIKSTNAGKIRRYANNTKVGGYTLYNPNQQRHYIELSERAEAYLRDVKGTGMVTSGAEGSHAKGVVSHGAGNKIDVVSTQGTSLQAWAKTALPFAQNPNTAYINFEFFNESEFRQVKELIYKMDPSLRKKGESRNIGGYMGGAKFFCHMEGKNSSGRHLDIGILPNSYVNQSNVNQGNQNKAKEIPKTSVQPKSPTPPQNDAQSKPQSKTVTPPTSPSKNSGNNLSNPSYKSAKKK